MKFTGKSPVPSRKPHVVVSLVTSHMNQPKLSSFFASLLTHRGSGSTLMTISKVSGVISTLVKGQSLIDCSVLDEVELATCVVFLVHLQSKERLVKKIYFWDHAAKDFYKKFTSSEHNPTVLLVTPVNTKRLVDKDVQPTIDYFNWFCSNPMIANLVNAEEVTKAETKIIRQIFAYIKVESANISASSNGCGFIADERNGTGSAIDESQKANRAKHGK
ncbi:hypothetical protein YC2023_077526 [Brassica napus]